MSPFLAWGDFHAHSRLAGFTILEEKWGTTRSLELDPHVHISEASSTTAPEGQSNSSLRLTKWHETFHLMYMKHLCITVGLEIA